MISSKITDLAAREQAASEAKAELAVIEAEYQAAKRALVDIAERFANAKAKAEKASGAVHLARIRAMLGV
jgi:hypothetical protein